MARIVLAAGALVAIAALSAPAFAQYSGPQGILGVNTSDEYSIAKRFLHREQYREAIPHLLSALADKPRDVEILNNLGYANRMIGEYDASLTYYKRALAISPNNKVAHENLGEVYLQMHNPSSAQKELDALASICSSGCDERDALAKAIAASAPAVPTATSAAPTSSNASSSSAAPTASAPAKP